MLQIQSLNKFSIPIKGTNCTYWKKFNNLQFQTTPSQYQLIYSFKKISQKMLKIESWNEVVTDGKMDGRTLHANFWMESIT